MRNVVFWWKAYMAGLEDWLGVDAIRSVRDRKVYSNVGKR